jgi:hypothetical protein
MGTILVAYPQYFKEKLFLKKLYRSDGVILKMAGLAIQPPPQVVIVSVLTEKIKEYKLKYFNIYPECLQIVYLEADELQTTGKKEQSYYLKDGRIRKYRSGLRTGQ